MTALPATTTALDAARHNLRWALRNGKPWDQIRHLRANVARAEGTRYYPDRLNEGDRYWYVFDLLATGGPGPVTFVQIPTKALAQQLADDRNRGDAGR